jgi:lysophospholipase
VTAFDWRGQGGSGRLSPAPNVGHADSFAPWIDDLADFYADWKSGAGPHVVMGHSMGGHLVLRALLELRIDPNSVVLVAPMLGLHSPIGARGGEGLARLLTRVGDPARGAWKHNERPHSIKSRESLLTHDHDRYTDEEWWYQAKPDIRLGPPSWAWLAEAFASTRAQQRDPRLLTLHIPIAMLVAEADGLVDPKAAIAVAGQLPDCALVRFGDESAHEILREAEPVRTCALAAIDAFLDARAPVSGQTGR